MNLALQIVSTLLMLFGLGFWVSILFSPHTPSRVAEGGRWLDWRPLPHDTGRVLVWGFLLSLALQSLVFGLFPGLVDAPVFLQVALTLVLYQGVLVWLVYGHLRRNRIPESQALAMGHGVKLFDMVWGLVGYCLLLPPVWLTMLFTEGFFRFMDWDLELQPMVRSVRGEASVAQNLAVLVLIGFVGPFLEEVIFRGVLFPVLVRKAGVWPGLLVQAALFSVIHLHAPSAPALFVLAVVLGLQYLYTRRLMTCVWTHALFNCMTLFYTLTLFTGNGEALP